MSKGTVLRVTFHGVRGSTPSPCDENRRYGGNTSSVELDAGDGSPLLLDMGTGVRPLGDSMEGPFVGAILVTHLHWDHVQGLPFFSPLLRPGASARIYGPLQPERSLCDAFAAFIQPPYFPINFGDLPCDVEVIGIADGEFEVGSCSVMSRSIPHVGETNGYRIESGGKTVVYIPDHQQPDDAATVHPGIVDLCRDADVLIHDAQYTPEEFVMKSTWGHCTIDYSIHVAATCGVKKLVLFHHDPSHDDETLDRLSAAAIEHGAERGVEVVAAFEGLSLEV